MKIFKWLFFLIFIYAVCILEPPACILTLKAVLLYGELILQLFLDFSNFGVSANDRLIDSFLFI